MLHDILRETISYYRIPLPRIAERVQLTANRISQIQNGSPCSTLVFQNILKAMDDISPGSMDYFFAKCIRHNMAFSLVLDYLRSSSLTDLQISEVMLALSEKVI